MTRRGAFRSALLLLTLTLAPPALAQTDPNAEANRLFHRVMSPYCPGRVLATCGSGAADALRQEVRRELAAGKLAADVEAALYRRFGDSIRGEPKTSGIGLLAWVLPAVMFALTGRWLVKRMTRVAEPGSGPQERSVSTSPEMLDRLEDELASL